MTRPEGASPLSRRIPGASAVRAEDAFDVEAVAAWLRSITPADPTVLAGTDLARGAEGLEVVSLRHDLRPAGKATAVDVLLHARSWVRR